LLLEFCARAPLPTSKNAREIGTSKAAAFLCITGPPTNWGLQTSGGEREFTLQVSLWTDEVTKVHTTRERKTHGW
jgi:hypothetical protein